MKFEVRKLICTSLRILVICSVGMLAGIAALYDAGGDTILTGVRVENVALGGLGIDEARDKLEKFLAYTVDGGGIIIQVENNKYRIYYSDIDAVADLNAAIKQAFNVGREGNFMQKAWTSFDVKLKGVALKVPVRFDDIKLKAEIKKIADSEEKPAVNAGIDLSGGEAIIKPEKNGRKLDSESLYKKVVKELRTGQGGLLQAECKVVEPEIKAAELRRLNKELRCYSSKVINEGEGKDFNNYVGAIKDAVEAINGAIVEPDREFSFKRALLRRGGVKNDSLENHDDKNMGFSIKAGEGYCQVSSTLYNAALLSGMDVTDRTPHSRLVPYVTAGRDAAVDKDKDLKIKNNLSMPVLIAAYVKNGQLQVKLYSDRSLNQRVVIEEKGKRILEPRVIYHYEPMLDKSAMVVKERGEKGAYVEIYRHIKRGNGSVEEEFISADRYSPVDRVISIGMYPVP